MQICDSYHKHTQVLLGACPVMLSQTYTGAQCCNHTSWMRCRADTQQKHLLAVFRFIQQAPSVAEQKKKKVQQNNLSTLSEKAKIAS